jgi:hypothetical protein
MRDVEQEFRDQLELNKDEWQRIVIDRIYGGKRDPVDEWFDVNAASRWGDGLKLAVAFSTGFTAGWFAPVPQAVMLCLFVVAILVLMAVVVDWLADPSGLGQ